MRIGLGREDALCLSKLIIGIIGLQLGGVNVVDRPLLLVILLVFIYMKY